MTGKQSDSETKATTSLRRRVGKIALMIGLLLITLTIILGTLVSMVAAYTGSTGMMQSFYEPAALGLGIGLMLAVVGLITMLLPEGPNEDWLWSAKTGPYIK